MTMYEGVQMLCVFFEMMVHIPGSLSGCKIWLDTGSSVKTKNVATNSWSLQESFWNHFGFSVVCEILLETLQWREDCITPVLKVFYKSDLWCLMI